MENKLNGFNDGKHASSGVGGRNINNAFTIQKKKIKIIIKEDDWYCGDGCCSDTYTTLFLNGEELEHPYSTKEEYFSNQYLGENVELSLEAVLKRLGFEVEIERVYKGDE